MNAVLLRYNAGIPSQNVIAGAVFNKELQQLALAFGPLLHLCFRFRLRVCWLSKPTSEHQAAKNFHRLPGSIKTKSFPSWTTPSQANTVLGRTYYYFDAPTTSKKSCLVYGNNRVHSDYSSTSSQD